MKKGCLIALGILGFLIVGGVGSCLFLAYQYDKGPRPPGERELMTVETELLTFTGAEGLGNTPEAEQLAQDFARSLRVARQMFFTEGKSGGTSLTKGHFITYCSLTAERCAFIVHVPELRNYAPDAQVTLAELAWRIAAESVRARNLQGRELAIGTRGVLYYSHILIGDPSAEKPLQGIKRRLPGTDNEALQPFFAGIQVKKPAPDAPKEIK